MMNIGQIPPQNIELEKAVLGALIIEPKAYLAISDILTVDAFYKDEHQIIFSVIIDLFTMNEPIDMITIISKLSKSGNLDEVGGAYYISKLTANVASAAHLTSHATEIVDLSIKRKIIQLSAELSVKAIDASYSTDDLLMFASGLVDKALNIMSQKSEVKDFAGNLKDAIDLISAKQNKKTSSNVKPVLRSLREKITDWNPGEVVIIAGRPGMAKTSLALFEVYEQAKLGHASVFFSLEMQADRLTNKCVQAETGLTTYDYEMALSPDDWAKIDGVYTRFNHLPIFIDDTALASLVHIRAKAKLFKEKYNIRFIVIDYIQLMGGERQKNSNREEFISNISRNLKALSKELNVTIFALSQLNRGVEQRSDKRPMLSDLRESGAIEQDADIVLFPFRPEYYWPGIEDQKGKGIIIVGKNRNGATGEATMNYNVSVTRFTDDYHDAFQQRQNPF